MHHYMWDIFAHDGYITNLSNLEFFFTVKDYSQSAKNSEN